MTFVAKASSEAEFIQWVDRVKASPALGQAEYNQLVLPSSYVPPSTYVLGDSGLFDRIIMKYMMPMPGNNDWNALWGRLTIDAFKHDLIEASVGVSILLACAGLVAYLTYYQRWRWLWVNWITSVDHKRIGIMYLLFSGVMLIKGVVDAAMMRAQQILSVGDSFGYLSTDHYQQLFTAHGTTMIFFVAMGFMFGIINYILPLQIGARDVAFPFLNNLSFWSFLQADLFSLYR